MQRSRAIHKERSTLRPEGAENIPLLSHVTDLYFQTQNCISKESKIGVQNNQLQALPSNDFFFKCFRPKH